MNYEPGWSYQPEKCDCDGQFIEWMRLGNPYGNIILHMGTGLHHKVGLELSGRNYVMGLTLSPEELLEYTSLVKDNPHLVHGYSVLFGDILDIPFPLFPQFNIVTLFHLFELYGYFGIVWADSDVSRLIKSFNLSSDPRILAYRNSAAKDLAIPLLDEHLNRIAEYKELIIYKPK